MNYSKKLIKIGELLADTAQFSETFELATQHNGWFTRENLTFAFKAWAEALSEQNVQQWLLAYNLKEEPTDKKVLIVMAGNIPLVGFHDLLCILVAGHKAIIKLSSDDKVLLPYIVKKMATIAPDWASAITFTDERINSYDAVIATGSNNTARYFEYYFGKKPHIIRKNRHSVAVLKGDENQEQLAALGEDIFRYYGLGCRSVSKLFVPQGYDFDNFFRAIYLYKDIIEEQKYSNNYDYNKAVYLMSLYKLLENGFLMLKEDESYASPIATVFYEYYSDRAALKLRLQADADQIQCVVAEGFTTDEIPFGYSQKPQLWDYADGVDTLQFLLSI